MDTVMESGQKTILIVDDEPDVVAYLTMFFEDNGYDVITASNGREGFEFAATKDPDLISLDITMPEESGFRMYQNLKETPSTKHIPVVIITGTPGEFTQFSSLYLSVDSPSAYFEKPVDRDQLLEKIKIILNNN